MAFFTSPSRGCLMVGRAAFDIIDVWEACFMIYFLTTWWDGSSSWFHLHLKLSLFEGLNDRLMALLIYRVND